MKSVNVVQNSCKCGHLSYDKEALVSCPSCGAGANTKWPSEYSHDQYSHGPMFTGRCPKCKKMISECSCNSMKYIEDQTKTLGE